MKQLSWLILSVIVLPFSHAGEIDLKKIMSDPIWIGKLPDMPLMGEDGALYFSRTTPIPLPREEVRLDLKTGKLTPVEDDHRLYAEMEKVAVLGDTRLYQVNGDLWTGTGDNPPQPLLVRGSRIAFIRSIGDGEFVYRQSNNLFLYNLEKGTDIQLTDLALRKEKKDDKETFYTVEERKLFRYVDHLYVRDEAREERREKAGNYGSYSKPETVYLGSGNIGPAFMEHYRYSLDISEDMRWVAANLSEDSDPENTEYAQFINKTGDVKARPSRPRVGSDDPSFKLAIIDRQDHSVKWLDLSELPEITTDRLSEIKEGLSEEDKKFLPESSDKPRSVQIVSAGFQSGGSHLLLTILSRDYKDRWVILLDPDTMEHTLVHHTYDPAWILGWMGNYGNGPAVMGQAFWRKDRQRVMLLSDHTGEVHLHEYNPQSKEMKALTEGAFRIFSPYQSEDGKLWYFHSNKEHRGERHFYSMPVDGGEWTRYTREPGYHEIHTTANGVMYGLFSRSDLPPQIRIRKKKKWKTLYDGRSEAFKAIKWHKPEVVTYANKDGLDVFARIYKPEKPNGAGVVFTHGAGYLQNAHKGWSTYFREYMFHNLLMREGYTVLDPDYRASSGYGRDWRTAIYRYMGDKDLADVIDGADFLVREHGIDKSRLGTYGGSYGGFLTLMAMFTSPDTFASGAALRPVTDWAYYNHWYTARILNTPRVDPVAYRRSSPIYFAENLKGRLLICHGMVDSNVYYQDSVRLAQRLIELGKHNWELSSYPVEPHSFRTPSGWYDEYRRIHELFTETLN